MLLWRNCRNMNHTTGSSTGVYVSYSSWVSGSGSCWVVCTVKAIISLVETIFFGVNKLQKSLLCSQCGNVGPSASKTA